jgi:hypothetical protein
MPVHPPGNQLDEHPLGLVALRFGLLKSRKQKAEIKGGNAEKLKH